MELVLNAKCGAPPVPLGMPETHRTQKSLEFEKLPSLERRQSHTLPHRFWRGLFQWDIPGSIFDSDSCILFKGCSGTSPDGVLLLHEGAPGLAYGHLDTGAFRGWPEVRLGLVAASLPLLFSLGRLALLASKFFRSMATVCWHVYFVSPSVTCCFYNLHSYLHFMEELILVPR